MSTTFSGPVISENGFEGAVTGAVVGNITGNVTGGQILPTATAYDGADAAGKAILPSVFNASLTKATAGTDYTLAVPGSANVNHIIHITSASAAAHVVTVTGLVGGTTMTFGAAIGNGFALLAVSATLWRVVGTLVGITQTA
jgi:hypothetical protein